MKNTIQKRKLAGKWGAGWCCPFKIFLLVKMREPVRIFRPDFPIRIFFC